MKMRTALMIAGGVGIVGFLIYRANVTVAPVTGIVPLPTGPQPLIKMPTVAANAQAVAMANKVLVTASS